MIGIGEIIGAGIFVIAGTAAAQHAGPAVLISFVIAGVSCLFAGLCYAEFASLIPESGSSYTYAYATMGRFMAWFIGWRWFWNISSRLQQLQWGGRAILSACSGIWALRSRNPDLCARSAAPVFPTCISPGRSRIFPPSR